jgi:hypothetical protein
MRIWAVAVAFSLVGWATLSPTAAREQAATPTKAEEHYRSGVAFMVPSRFLLKSPSAHSLGLS